MERRNGKAVKESVKRKVKIRGGREEEYRGKRKNGKEMEKG